MADPVYPTDDANDRLLPIGRACDKGQPQGRGVPVITEHDTWTDYGVRALPNRLLVVNLDPSAAARCPTPADAIDTGQANLLMAGVVTPALAAVWLARADNADLSAVVVSNGPEECIAGAGVLRFVVAIDENTAAGVFSIPVSNVDPLRHAVAAAAQVAGHPFHDEDTPVVALDPAGRPVFGGPALGEITAPEAFVIVANAT